MEVDLEARREIGGSSSLTFVTGVVSELHRVRSMERVLWRATRGNLYFRSVASEHDPEVHVFVVLFHGSAIEAKVRKISNAFGARLFACPDSAAARALLSKVSVEKNQKKNSFFLLARPLGCFWSLAGNERCARTLFCSIGANDASYWRACTCMVKGRKLDFFFS